MANPWYTFEQNSFPGRIARAQEVNTQFTRIEQAFEDIGELPAGSPNEIQFHNASGDLAGDANLTWNGAKLDVTGALDASGNVAFGGTLGVTGAATFSSSLVANSLEATTTLTTGGNGTIGGDFDVSGKLDVTGKVTAAATVDGDTATTVATKGWAEGKFADTSHTHAAGDITSGTFADARIAESSVTQHQGAIDHDALTNYSAAEHRVINDGSTANNVLWSAEKINDELQSIVAGENPPAGSDGMVQYNNDGLYGGQEEFSWDDTAYKLTVGSATNAGSFEIIGGKGVSAATVNGDPSGTMITKGWAEGKFATSGHTHAAGDVTSGTFDAARIPGLDASKITAGTLSFSRGGTGILNYSSNSYLQVNGSGTGFVERTASEVLTDIGAASTTHTHAAADVTSGTFADARIPDLAASKIVSGTFGVARIPDLDASKIATGTFGSARIPSLDASKIGSGILATGRGGTGMSSFTSGYFMKASSSSSLTMRSPAGVRSDIGAAATSHTHSAANITSGTLSSDRLPEIPSSKFGDDTIGFSKLVDLASAGLLGSTGGGSVLALSPSSVQSMLNVLQPAGSSTGGQVTVSTGSPSGGSNGDIWLKY